MSAKVLGAIGVAAGGVAFAAISSSRHEKQRNKSIQKDREQRSHREKAKYNYGPSIVRGGEDAYGFRGLDVVDPVKPLKDDLEIPSGLLHMTPMEQINAAEGFIIDNGLSEIEYCHRETLLTPNGVARVHLIAQVLNKCPNLTLQIACHTGGDVKLEPRDVKRKKQFLKLSQDRAEAVKDMMRELWGVKNKIVCRGLGGERRLVTAIVAFAFLGFDEYVRKPARKVAGMSPSHRLSPVSVSSRRQVSLVATDEDSQDTSSCEGHVSSGDEGAKSHDQRKGSKDSLSNVPSETSQIPNSGPGRGVGIQGTGSSKPKAPSVDSDAVSLQFSLASNSQSSASRNLSKRDIVETVAPDAENVDRRRTEPSRENDMLSMSSQSSIATASFRSAGASSRSAHSKPSGIVKPWVGENSSADFDFGQGSVTSDCSDDFEGSVKIVFNKTESQGWSTPLPEVIAEALGVILTDREQTMPRGPPLSKPANPGSGLDLNSCVLVDL